MRILVFSMKKHIVTEILGEPEQIAITFDDIVHDKFWTVSVRVKVETEEFETSISFDELSEIQNLKIGDEFFR